MVVFALMMRLASLASFVVAVSLVGCAAAPKPRFRDGRFEQPAAGYHVPSAVPGQLAFVGPDWMVDNFQSPLSNSRLKRGSAYEYESYLDTNGDGVSDPLGTLPLYDLRLINRRHNGSIWVRSVPVSNHTYRMDLRALLERYVNEISGAGYTRVALGQGGAATERRFAARVLSSEPIRIDGQLAAAAVLEVANVDQLQLDSSSRTEKVAVVITRAKGRFRTRASGTFPMLLVAGYANSPAAFEASFPDFQRFVATIRL